jgi:ABC-type bacteriocin/lantibiotic exporter with double-glycine peptidase domain
VAGYRKGPLLFLIAALFLLSCRAVIPPETPLSKAQIIPNVPFYPQETFQCGPASLAEVFNFWGTRISPEEIARDIYSPSARGTLTMDMVFYAEKKGFVARPYKGDLKDIQKRIDDGYPLVVLVDYGFSFYEKSHFAVLLGYNESGFFMHSGKEKEIFIPTETFMQIWGKADFWTLLLLPKGHGR